MSAVFIHILANSYDVRYDVDWHAKYLFAIYVIAYTRGAINNECNLLLIVDDDKLNRKSYMVYNSKICRLYGHHIELTNISMGQCKNDVTPVH